MKDRDLKINNNLKLFKFKYCINISTLSNSNTAPTPIYHVMTSLIVVQYLILPYLSDIYSLLQTTLDSSVDTL